jgi:hypothetical protein
VAYALINRLSQESGIKGGLGLEWFATFFKASSAAAYIKPSIRWITGASIASIIAD